MRTCSEDVPERRVLIIAAVVVIVILVLLHKENPVIDQKFFDDYEAEKKNLSTARSDNAVALGEIATAKAAYDAASEKGAAALQTVEDAKAKVNLAFDALVAALQADKEATLAEPVTAAYSPWMTINLVKGLSSAKGASGPESRTLSSEGPSGLASPNKASINIVKALKLLSDFRAVAKDIRGLVFSAMGSESYAKASAKLEEIRGDIRAHNWAEAATDMLDLAHEIEDLAGFIDQETAMKLVADLKALIQGCIDLTK